MARRLQLPSGQTGRRRHRRRSGRAVGRRRCAQGDVILSVNRQAGVERGRSRRASCRQVAVGPYRADPRLARRRRGLRHRSRRNSDGLQIALHCRFVDLIRERGPLTVAAFMELALYDPEFGYYARAAQRSGRAGDFFTSVDVGPLFGELLDVQIAEMADILTSRIQASGASISSKPAPATGGSRPTSCGPRAAAIRRSTSACGCTWSRRAPAARAAQRADARRRSPIAWRRRRRSLPDVVRRRAGRQRAARRAAGASGRHAARTGCARCTSDGVRPAIA